MILKKIYPLFISFFFVGTVFCQACDCYIYPIATECKDTCAIRLLRQSSKMQLKKQLNLSEETSQKITNVKSRNKLKSVNDFQNILPYKYYIELEEKINEWQRGPSINQTNTNGDNVGHDKVTNYNYRDSINAPNALIATSNQSGGQNIVNYTSNEFKPLPSALKNKILFSLDSLLKKYPSHPYVAIDIRQGSYSRKLVALELDELFRMKYLGNLKENVFNFSDEPISIFIDHVNLQFAIDLMKSINSFISGEFKIIENKDWDTTFMRIYLSGEPIFTKFGQAKFQ